MDNLLIVVVAAFANIVSSTKIVYNIKCKNWKQYYLKLTFCINVFWSKVEIIPIKYDNEISTSLKKQCALKVQICFRNRSLIFAKLWHSGKYARMGFH